MDAGLSGQWFSVDEVIEEVPEGEGLIDTSTVR